MTNNHGAYYNEVSPHAADWLRNLIAAGHIAPGYVDDRDVRDVCARDLDGYTQHHFFAGIGIWSLALRMAGWPDDRPVWTGSCPCQPFSAAGKGLGFADERHLWPAWFWLIGQHRPDVVFGEQVASADGLMWLDLVLADLEGCGYAGGPVDFPSAGVGAPNIRQRLWWVTDRVADTQGGRRRVDGLLGQASGVRQDTGQPALVDETVGRLGNPSSPRLPHPEPPHVTGSGWWGEGRAAEQSGGPFDPWRELEWIDCLDGKRRPTQSGLFPLAARHPGDVAKLRAYGNAINPEVAAEFVRAYLDVVHG